MQINMSKNDPPVLIAHIHILFLFANKDWRIIFLGSETKNNAKQVVNLISVIVFKR